LKKRNEKLRHHKEERHFHIKKDSVLSTNRPGTKALEGRGQRGRGWHEYTKVAPNDERKKKGKKKSKSLLADGVRSSVSESEPCS